MRDADEMKVPKNGRPLSRDEAAKTPILVAGTNLPDKKVAFAFAFISQEAFSGWARTTVFAEEVDHTQGIIVQRSGFEHRDTKIEDAQRRHAEDVNEALGQFAARVGMDVGSKRFAAWVMIDWPTLEPPFSIRGGCGAIPVGRGHGFRSLQVCPCPTSGGLAGTIALVPG